MEQHVCTSILAEQGAEQTIAQWDGDVRHGLTNKAAQKRLKRLITTNAKKSPGSPFLPLLGNHSLDDRDRRHPLDAGGKGGMTSPSA